uniref:Uncharacterized protein n=1 Tax=viral metagenome TaxID=1070528 RepID=A0A6C0JJP0_9ZZZZ
MEALPQVFGQLEAAVTALPDTYTGKEGYKAWIADAKLKYATPPTDVNGYITGLKAAGTALRGKMAVPDVPVAAPVMAAVAAAPAGAAAAPPAGAAAAPPVVTTQTPVVTTQTPVDTAATTQTPVDTAATTQTPVVTTQTPVDTAATTQTPVVTTQTPVDTAATTQTPVELEKAEAAPRPLIEVLSSTEAQPGRVTNPDGLDGGRYRKTHHQTPKRRRSGKKGRKGLSKKKTGSRK